MEMTLAEVITDEIEFVETDTPYMLQRYNGINIYSTPWYSDYSFTVDGKTYGDFEEFVMSNAVLFMDKRPMLNKIAELNEQKWHGTAMDNWLSAAEEILNEPIDDAIEAYHNESLTTIQEDFYYIDQAETEEDMYTQEYAVLEQSGLMQYIHDYINKIKENY